MKTAKRFYLTVLAILGATTTALAAGEPREDTSGLFVWAFMGLCALIVAAQVIPALLMTIGAARGVAEGIREKVRRTAEDEVPAG